MQENPSSQALWRFREPLGTSSGASGNRGGVPVREPLGPRPTWANPPPTTTMGMVGVLTEVSEPMIGNSGNPKTLTRLNNSDAGR